MLHSRVSDSTLGVVRIAVYGMWLKHLLEDSLSRYVDTPLELFQPIGPLAWIPADWWPWLYRAEVMEWSRIALLVGTVACIAGLRPYRPIALATCGGLTLYQAFVRGYAYMHHGEMAMLLAAYVLAVYPANRGLSVGRSGLRSRAPEREAAGDVLNRAALLTFCLALCLTYSYVGLELVLQGGDAIYLNSTIVHHIAFYTFGEDLESPGIGRWVLEVPALGSVANLGFALTTFFELLSPLAIFSRRFRWLWIPAIVGFHVAAGLLMQMWFTANIALVLLCMTDLDAILARVDELLARLGLGPWFEDRPRGRRPEPAEP